MPRTFAKTKTRGKKKKALSYLTHRYSIMAFNSLIVVITALIIYDMLQLILDTIDNAEDLENVSDGIGTILIGYGVIIEERETLMDFFGLYPEHFNERQEVVDHFCHWYGLLYLILGLLMEIGVQVIKIPDRLINTTGLEEPIFSVNIIFMLLAVYSLLKHNRLLLNPIKSLPLEPIGEAASSAETHDALDEA